jgi:hypothetical protein
MTTKSVIQIDIDPDGKFAAFHKEFSEYQKKLKDMPEDWAKVIDVIDDAGEGMEGFSESSKHSKDFLMIAAIQADAISKAMYRATGVQDKFNVKAKDGAIQMTRMQKASAAMQKSIVSMSTILLKLGTVGVGGVGSALGAVYGATSTVAGQNVQARGLGLRIGQTQAFDANFERFGLGTSDLGNVANAQGDVSRWRAFIAAGLTPQQIQNEDAEQLTYDFARAAATKYRGWKQSGMPAASMAKAYGFTDFYSIQQLNAMQSQPDAKWVAAQNKTLADAKANEINQGTADQASDVKAALQSDWAKVLNTFNESLAKAGPDLVVLGDAASKAAIALAKFIDKEVTPVVHEITTGQPTPKGSKNYTKLDALVDWMHGTKVGNWIDRNLLGSDSSSPSADPLGALVDAQYTVESNRGKNLKSPKGALGPLQFMPDTWKEWGHGDVNNLQDSMDAARRYDTFLLKRYGGDVRKALAAYNWGMGNVDKAISKYGDNWESHSPSSETQPYINKIMALLARQGQSVNINITNSTTANVATSMNAAPH